MSKVQFIQISGHTVIPLELSQGSEVRSHPISSHERDSFQDRLKGVPRLFPDSGLVLLSEDVDGYPIWYLRAPFWCT
jgi:hypothetical protein